MDGKGGAGERLPVRLHGTLFSVGASVLSLDNKIKISLNGAGQSELALRSVCGDYGCVLRDDLQYCCQLQGLQDFSKMFVAEGQCVVGLTFMCVNGALQTVELFRSGGHFVLHSSAAHDGNVTFRTLLTACACCLIVVLHYV